MDAHQKSSEVLVHGRRACVVAALGYFFPHEVIYSWGTKEVNRLAGCS